MKKIFFTCFALGTLASVPLFAQGDEPRPITLAEALQLANRESPLMVQARANVSNSHEQVRANFAQFLPSFGVSAGGTNTSGASYVQGVLLPNPGDPWSFGKGYNARLTLLDGGTRYFNIRAAQSTLRANDEGELATQFNVAYNVKLQYYAALAARESEAAAARALETGQQNFNISVSRLRVGAVARTDSLTAAIAVGTAKLAILAARNALHNANASLTRLVGSPTTVTAIAADTSAAVHIDIDDTELQRLVDDGPSVRQSRALYDASIQQRRSTFSRSYIPTVSLGYNYSVGNSAQYFTWAGGPGSKNTSYSLGVSYNIFDNYQRELGMSIALSSERVAEAQFRDAKLAARESLALLLNAFRTAEETITLQQLQVDAAAATLEAQMQRYGLGAATQVDLLTAQTALDNARVQLIQARFTARTSKAQIEALVGKELPQ